MARYTAGDLVQSAESGRYLQQPLPELRRMIAEGTTDIGQRFVSPQRISAAADVLRDHLKHHDALQSEAAENNRHGDNQKHFTKIDGRLVTLESVALRPERKTFAFWFSVVGMAIAALALLVSYLAWQRPNEPRKLVPDIQSTPAPTLKQPNALPIQTAPEPVRPSVETKPVQKTPEPPPAKELPKAPDKAAPAEKKPDKPVVP